jgi:hypothetical protein
VPGAACCESVAPMVSRRWRTAFSRANGAPLQSFVPGEYRLEITVTDRAADETSVQTVDFTVQ